MPLAGILFIEIFAWLSSSGSGSNITSSIDLSGHIHSHCFLLFIFIWNSLIYLFFFISFPLPLSCELLEGWDFCLIYISIWSNAWYMVGNSKNNLTIKNNMKCCHYSNNEYLHNPHSVSSLHVLTHLILITILKEITIIIFILKMWKLTCQ